MDGNHHQEYLYNRRHLLSWFTYTVRYLQRDEKDRGVYSLMWCYYINLVDRDYSVEPHYTLPFITGEGRNAAEDGLLRVCKKRVERRDRTILRTFSIRVRDKLPPVSLSYRCMT